MGEDLGSFAKYFFFKAELHVPVNFVNLKSLSSCYSFEHQMPMVAVAIG